MHIYSAMTSRGSVPPAASETTILGPQWWVLLTGLRWLGRIDVMQFHLNQLTRIYFEFEPHVYVTAVRKCAELDQESGLYVDFETMFPSFHIR